MNNLLAQRKEIKRLEKEEGRRRAEEVEMQEREDERAKTKAVEEFERVQMGLEGSGGKEAGGKKRGGLVVSRADGEGDGGKGEEKWPSEEQEQEQEKKGKKRKLFELDEKELIRLAKEERSRAKKALDEEKHTEASKKQLPSFWVPSLTPSSSSSINQPDTLHDVSKPPKLHPICPASNKDRPHHYSLKALVSVHFTEEQKENDKGGGKSGETVRVCPSCKKVLSNATKAICTLLLPLSFFFLMGCQFVCLSVCLI